MPRTLAQNAQYIANTIKPAIKSAIEAQGVTVPSTDSFLDYADRIAEIEGGGSGYQLKDLPTGSISTVNDAAELPLNALKVSVEAWQEGSGDPSPSNIRPIHGWDSGEITVCDDIQSPTQTETTTLDFPTAIYGAEWGVVNGGMKQTDGYIVFDGSSDEGWGLENGGKRVYSGMLRGIAQGSAQGIADITSNQFKATTSARTLAGDEGISIDGSGWLCVADGTGAMSVADWNTYLSEHPLQVRYKLATPTTINLSPLSIRLLQGTSNIYADCGEILEGEYFVDEGAIDVRKVDYQIGSSGSIKTTDGRVLSGFASMSGYHSRPLDVSGNWLDVDWSKSFEIGVAFKMTEYPGSNASQYIFGNGTNDLGYRFRTPRVYFSDYWQSLLLDMSLDGSSWYMDASVNFKPVLNTWYFIRLKFDLSTLRITLDITTDFETYTTLHTEVLSSGLYHNGSAIGIGGDQPTASDSTTDSFMVDTFNTYIKGDGVSWGASTGAFPS